MEWLFFGRNWIWGNSNSVVVILYAVFWLYLLIDCIRREPDWIWLWLIIILQPLGPILYLIFRWLPYQQFTTPHWLQQFFRQRELAIAELAARNIGNAHQFVKLGELYEEMGRLEKALHAFQQACQKEPENKPALWGLGRVALRLKLLEQSLPSLEKLLQLEPGYKFGEPSLAYGETLVGLGRWEEARAHMERHLTKHESPQARVICGQIYTELQKQALARQHYEFVLLHYNTATANRRLHRRWVRAAKRGLAKLPKDK